MLVAAVSDVARVAIIDWIDSIDCRRTIMPSITIRNLDEALKARLRVRAAQRGHSMEEEARDILRAALAQKHTQKNNLAASIRARFAPLGGVELPLPPREPMREPPELDA
jgi:plasmid stability protein